MSLRYAAALGPAFPSGQGRHSVRHPRRRGDRARPGLRRRGEPRRRRPRRPGIGRRPVPARPRHQPAQDAGLPLAVRPRTGRRPRLAPRRRRRGLRPHDRRSPAFVCDPARRDGATFGDGDLPVHRHRGLDPDVGRRRRRDAIGPGGPRRRCCARWSKRTAAGCSSTPATACAPCSPRRAPRSRPRSRRSDSWSCPCGWAWPPARPRARDGDYFGLTLNRAARVMAAGHGGQILVPDSTAALLDDVMSTWSTSASTGSATWRRHPPLPGAGRGARVDVPAPADDRRHAGQPAGAAHELPRPRRGAEGGRRAGADAAARDPHRRRRGRQDPARGAGRRRARRASSPTACGWSSWRRSAIPPPCPTPWPRRWGSRPRPTSSVTESIARALSGRRMLIVLDNCEHVLDAAAELVADDPHPRDHRAGPGHQPRGARRRRRARVGGADPRRRRRAGVAGGRSCSSNGRGP